MIHQMKEEIFLTETTYLMSYPQKTDLKFYMKISKLKDWNDGKARDSR